MIRALDVVIYVLGTGALVIGFAGSIGLAVKLWRGDDAPGFEPEPRPQRPPVSAPPAFRIVARPPYDWRDEESKAHLEPGVYRHR